MLLQRKFGMGAILAACVLLAGTLAGAQDSKDSSKIGYIDLQRVVYDSKVGKAGIEKLKQFQDTRQQEITDKEKALLKLKQDYESQQLAMSDTARKAQEDKISDSEIALKRLLEDSERDLRDKKGELLERIQGEILDLISKYGQEKGYAIILQKDESVLYANPVNDVTNAIIERYDKVAKP